MFQINLLPWREKIRREKKKIFLQRTIAFCTVTALILIVFHFLNANKVRNQLVRNNYIQEEINITQNEINSFNKQKLELEKIEKQINFIKQIFASNNNVIKLLNGLLALIPSDITIDKLQRKNNIINFTGVAPTDAAVTLFMQAFSKSTLFETPQLLSINPAKDPKKRSFELEFKQKG